MSVKFRLTKRQSEIVALLADGLTTKEVATHLRIKERTAGQHIQQILNVTGAANRTHAVAMWLRETLGECNREIRQ